MYNRNKANRAVVNEPEPMQAFSAKSVYVSASDTVKVEITAKLPSGVAGAVIRRSTTGYPTSETEGELFKNITANGTYTDIINKRRTFDQVPDKFKADVEAKLLEYGYDTNGDPIAEEE